MMEQVYCLNKFILKTTVVQVLSFQIRLPSMESERPEKRLKVEAGVEKDTGKTGVEKDEEILRLKNRVKELENLVQEEKSKNGENKNKVIFLFPGNINLVLSCIDRVAMNCGTS